MLASFTNNIMLTLHPPSPQNNNNIISLAQTKHPSIMMKRSIAILLLGAPAAVYGFVPASHPPRQQRQALVCAVKRGKGLDVGGEGGGGTTTTAGSASPNPSSGDPSRGGERQEEGEREQG